MRIITSTQYWFETTIFHLGPCMGKAKTYLLHLVTIYSHTSAIPTLWRLGKLGSPCHLSLASVLALHGDGACSVSLACAVALIGAGVYTSGLRLCLRTMPDRVRKRPAGAALPALAFEAAVNDVPPGPEAEEPTWTSPAHGREAPSTPQADHIVHNLVNNCHVAKKIGQSSNSASVVGLSLNALREALQPLICADVQWRLRYTCDAAHKIIEFARANHKPRHVGNTMSQRIIATGELWCTGC